MPKFKSFDWSGTWSPENEVEEIPTEIASFLSNEIVTKAFAVIEKDADHKGHLHFGFRLRREYDSNYKWWKKDFEEVGFKEPALLIRATKNLHGLVGGYCSKAEGTQVVFRRSFTDEELAYGRKEYENGKARQRIIKFTDEFRTVHPAKFDITLGSIKAEYNISDNEEAIRKMADLRFAFANSNRGETSDYTKHQYLEYKRHNM